MRHDNTCEHGLPPTLPRSVAAAQESAPWCLAPSPVEQANPQGARRSAHGFVPLEQTSFSFKISETGTPTICSMGSEMNPGDDLDHHDAFFHDLRHGSVDTMFDFTL